MSFKDEFVEIEVDLSESTASFLEREAKRTGLSEGTILRYALVKYLIENAPVSNNVDNNAETDVKDDAENNTEDNEERS